MAYGSQASATVKARLAAAEARVKEIDEQLALANQPEPMIAFTTGEITEYLREKLSNLQSVLTSTPLVGKRIIRKHIKKIMLTPAEVDGKRAFYATVEFELGGGDSCVMLTGSMDASMQQYGFSTITVPGLALDTSRVRRKAVPPKQTAENGGAAQIVLA